MAATGQLERTLKVLLVLSVVGPAVLFGLASVNDYFRLLEQARGIVQKNVDILHEHALKVFETQELVIDRINAMLRGYDWQTIAGSAEIHAFLRDLDQRLEQISAIWLVGPESRYWANSTTFPANAYDVATRPFFAADDARGNRPLSFWTAAEVFDPDDSGYKIIRRRSNPSGQFDGLIILSISPRYFRDFYTRFMENPRDTVGLIRGDGTVLLRNLPLEGRAQKLSESSTFTTASAASTEGSFSAKSSIDGVSRIVGYRKIDDYDAYVYFGLDRWSVERALLWRVLAYAALALGVGAALFMMTRTALRHAQRTTALQARLTALNATLEDRVMDRTARLESANERLRSMVSEKELLLREIHHRVKNNLQVVSSLLNLQAGATGKAEEFRDSLRRIRAMADLHESIYQSADISAVPFSRYLTTLTNDTVRFWTTDAQITSEIDAEPLVLDLDTATPLALLANEVLSNACKHAFPSGGEGRIIVRLRADGDRARFSVEDNGVGLPSDFAIRRESYLGIRIIDSLARQLGGRAEYEVDGGTRFTLDFPLPTDRKGQVPGVGEAGKAD